MTLTSVAWGPLGRPIARRRRRTLSRWAVRRAARAASRPRAAREIKRGAGSPAAASGPSRNVPPEIGDRRSPPCGVLGPGNATGIAPVLRPCLAAPAAVISSATLREDPLALRRGRAPGRRVADQPHHYAVVVARRVAGQHDP